MPSENEIKTTQKNNSTRIVLQSTLGGKKIATDKKNRIVLIKSLDEINDLEPELSVTIRKALKKRNSNLKRALNTNYVFANFQHMLPNQHSSRPFVVLLPKTANIDSLYIEIIAQGNSHYARLRFRLTQDMTLIPQSADHYAIYSANEDIIYTPGVQSTENSTTPNEVRSFFKSLTGEYINTIQLATSRSSQKGTQIISSTEIINIDKVAKQNILRALLARADFEDRAQINNFAFQSRLHNILDVLREGIPQLSKNIMTPYTVIQEVIELGYGSSVKDITHQSTENYSHLTQSLDFNKMLKRVALYILNNKISLADLENSFALIAQQTPEENKTRQIATSEFVKKITEYLQKEWHDFIDSEAVKKEMAKQNHLNQLSHKSLRNFDTFFKVTQPLGPLLN